MSRGIALLVDDVPQYVTEFSKKFGPWLSSRHGLQLSGKESAKEAMRFLDAKEGQRVGLVLVDILLPIGPLPAIRLFRHVKKKHPKVKRIAITGQAQRPTIWQMADEQLIDGFVDKEFEDRQIRQEISRVIQSPRRTDLGVSVAEAVRAYLRKNPAAAQKRIHRIGGKATTLAEIAQEIEKGTEFGKTQERRILELTVHHWSRAKAHN
ncbi:MAG: response regulator [Phycisphaerae bacterium]|nr:response regulator [Phycisphaerae bacterium]